MRELTLEEQELIAGGSDTGSGGDGGDIVVVADGGGGDYGDFGGGDYGDYGGGDSGGDSGGGGGGDSGSGSANEHDVPGAGVLHYDENFIAQHEGGRLLDAYVPLKNGQPAGQSGITIATGVDLGHHTFAEIKSNFVDYWAQYPVNNAYPNFEQSRRDMLAWVDTLQPYMGRTGQDAVDFLAANPLHITDFQARVLDTGVQQDALNTLVSAFNQASSTDFQSLPYEAQTVIIDVSHQYGPGLSNATPNFWNQVTSGAWTDAYNNLRNFGDDYTTRRNDEADLLKQAIDSGALH